VLPSPTERGLFGLAIHRPTAAHSHPVENNKPVIHNEAIAESDLGAVESWSRVRRFTEMVALLDVAWRLLPRPLKTVAWAVAFVVVAVLLWLVSLAGIPLDGPLRRAWGTR